MPSSHTRNWPIWRIQGQLFATVLVDLTTCGGVGWEERVCFYFWLILCFFLMFLSLLSSWKNVITTTEAERQFTGSIALGEMHDTECPEVIKALAQPATIFVTFTTQHLLCGP